MEKTITYQNQNTYSTLNTLTEKTKRVWLVFHGMGYLSKFFIKHFRSLNPEENYAIAPQAPSKYYLKDDFKYVGASWLTKENTLVETQNVLNYVDAVLQEEAIPKNIELIVFGFSQGVSIAMRWIASRKISCDKLVLYAGGIPRELKKEDFDYLNHSTIEVKMIYGDKDHYLTEIRLLEERKKLELLFSNQAEEISFEGGHEVRSDIIKNLF